MRPGRGRQLSDRLVPGDGPLARARPVLVFLVVLALFAAAVLTGGVIGALLLGLLAAGVCLLLVATWPRLGRADRVLRLLVLGMLVVLAINLVR